MRWHAHADLVARIFCDEHFAAVDLGWLVENFFLISSLFGLVRVPDESVGEREFQDVCVMASNDIGDQHEIADIFSLHL